MHKSDILRRIPDMTTERLKQLQRTYYWLSADSPDRVTRYDKIYNNIVIELMKRGEELWLPNKK